MRQSTQLTQLSQCTGLTELTHPIHLTHPSPTTWRRLARASKASNVTKVTKASNVATNVSKWHRQSHPCNPIRPIHPMQPIHPFHLPFSRNAPRSYQSYNFYNSCNSNSFHSSNSSKLFHSPRRWNPRANLSTSSSDHANPSNHSNTTTTPNIPNTPPNIPKNPNRSNNSNNSRAGQTKLTKFPRFSLPLAVTGLSLVCLSDPFLSTWEEWREGEDVNRSYWMDQYQKHQQKQTNATNAANVTNGKNITNGTNGLNGGRLREQGQQGCRLRNAHKHNAVNSPDDKAKETIETTVNTSNTHQLPHKLPQHAKVVIVGGGMAGLHTALALAERMHDPGNQGAHPPPIFSTTTTSTASTSTASTASTSSTSTALAASATSGLFRSLGSSLIWNIFNPFRRWFASSSTPPTLSSVDAGLMPSTDNHQITQIDQIDQKHQMNQIHPIGNNEMIQIQNNQINQINQMHQINQINQINQIDQETNNEIVILEASSIGNYASGRAKGMVVAGFQAPLEDLILQARDYKPSSTSPTSQLSTSSSQWSIPQIVLTIQSFLSPLTGSTIPPKYSMAEINQLYDASYVALDRLRDIVKKYGIECEWLESGAVEASIHRDPSLPSSDSSDSSDSVEEDEEDDGSCDEEGEEEEEEEEWELTSQQVNQILGIPSNTNGNDDNHGTNSNHGSNGNLYQCGEFDPTCAGVNPLLLTLGLADAVERWGVKIYEFVKVVGLEKVEKHGGNDGNDATDGTDGFGSAPNNNSGKYKGKYILTTHDGHNVQTITCDHVVLCMGPWQSTQSSWSRQSSLTSLTSLRPPISKRLAHSMVPIYTWMGSTQPLGEECPLKDGAVDLVFSDLSDPSDGSGEPMEQLEQSEDGPVRPVRPVRPAPMCGDDHISLNYWRRSPPTSPISPTTSGTNDDNDGNDTNNPNNTNSTTSTTSANNTNDEGRLLFGSLSDTYQCPTWMASLRIKNALLEVYPQLKYVRDVRDVKSAMDGKVEEDGKGVPLTLEHVWCGKLAFAVNSMPLIGRDVDFDYDSNNGDHVDCTDCTDCTDYTKGGVWYATGFAGHGIVPTALAGSVVANAILGIRDIPDIRDSDADQNTKCNQSNQCSQSNQHNQQNHNQFHQQWQLFHTYFPPCPWNGYPFSRLGAGFVLGVYNLWDWLGKKGVPLPPLPRLW